MCIFIFSLYRIMQLYNIINYNHLREHVYRLLWPRDEHNMRHTEVVGLWRPTDAPPGGKTRVSRATDQGASHTSHAHKFVIKSTAMIRQSSLTRFIVNKKNNTGDKIHLLPTFTIIRSPLNIQFLAMPLQSLIKKKNIYNNKT